MACYFPLTAWRPLPGFGPGLVFNSAHGLPSTRMEIPCGQCIGCRLDRARSWAVRCLHEASLYSDNIFLTLTYENASETLNRVDFPAFFKRLRKSYGSGIRFFHCAEYGELLQRPHHHAVVFNFRPPDLVPISVTGDYVRYTSPSVEKLWGHGFITVSDVTFDAACYVAKYCIKLVNGEASDKHYDGRMPEHVTMSRRPGIGYDWLKKYPSDVYNHDSIVIKDSFIAKPPKYYDAKFDLDDPVRLALLKEKRKEAALKRPALSFLRRQQLADAKKKQLKQYKRRKFEEV